MSTIWDTFIQATIPEASPSLETIWGKIPEQALNELDDECVHYFIIPTGRREVIGECKLCHGERRFKNFYEAPVYNTGTTAQQLEAYSDARQNGLTGLEGLTAEA